MSAGNIRVATVGGELHAVSQARSLGVDVVAVHVRGKYDPRMADHCERVIEVPALADHEAILSVLAPLHQERKFERVLTTSEFGGISTARVSAALGTPTTGVDVAVALKDKWVMRQRLAEAALSPVRCAQISSVGELRSFHSAVGGPVVIKPVDGTASAHVIKVDSAAEIKEAWATYLKSGNQLALAEEFLNGPVGSVETFSRHGRHLPVAVTEYFMNDRFVETGTVVPSRVAGAMAEPMKAMAVRMLDALGVTDGPAHTEFVLTPDGPRVLESHNRLAGGGTTDLVRRAYGVDMSRMFLAVPLDLEPLPEQVPPPRGSAIRFLNPPPGEVTRIHGLDTDTAKVVQIPRGTRVAGTPGLELFAGHEVGALVMIHEGDVVPPLDAGWNRSVGYVVASGSSGAEAATRCEAVLAELRIETR